jgi:hypothetical protein
MILSKKRSNVFDSCAKHICFAVNAEGMNDAGFASIVGRKYWQEIVYPGEQTFGTILTKTIKDRTFHAIVCHSLDYNGWENTPTVIKEALDKIGKCEETIACVLMGNSPVGLMMGANVRAILEAMEQSTAKVEVYSLSDFPKDTKDTEKNG